MNSLNNQRALWREVRAVSTLPEEPGYFAVCYVCVYVRVCRVQRMRLTLFRYRPNVPLQRAVLRYPYF